MTGTKLRQGLFLDKQSLHCITIHCITYILQISNYTTFHCTYTIMFACINNAGFLETYFIILELKVHLHPTQNCSDILVSSWQCFQLFSSYILTWLSPTPTIVKYLTIQYACHDMQYMHLASLSRSDIVNNTIGNRLRIYLYIQCKLQNTMLI